MTATRRAGPGRAMPKRQVPDSSVPPRRRWWLVVACLVFFAAIAVGGFLLDEAFLDDLKSLLALFGRISR
jgi:hypothetical protein